MFPLLGSDLKIRLCKTSDQFINSYDLVSRTSIISGFIEECDLKLKDQLFKQKHLFNIKNTLDNLENISESILKVFINLEISHKRDFIDNYWPEILKSVLIKSEDKIEIFQNMLSHCNENLRMQLWKIVEDFNSNNINDKILVDPDFLHSKLPEILEIEKIKDQIVNDFKDCIEDRNCIDVYDNRDTVLRIQDEMLLEELIMQNFSDL